MDNSILLDFIENESYNSNGKIERGWITLNDISTSKTGGRHWFYKHWGLLLTIIIALTFGIWNLKLQFRMKKMPELTYYVHPIKAVVLRRGEASTLRVFYRNQEINTDVTTTQVAIWNQGRMSIRTDNILSEVRLLTEPRVPILEATIRKQSRSIIGFVLDNSHFAEGIVPISWKILEQNDGAVIQLTYAGSPMTAIAVEGILENQPRIYEVKFSERIRSASEQFRAQISSLRSVVIFCFGFFLLAMGMFSLDIYIIIWRRKRGLKPPPRGLTEPIDWPTVFMAVVLLGAGIYHLSKLLKVPSPPFGF